MLQSLFILPKTLAHLVLPALQNCDKYLEIKRSLLWLAFSGVSFYGHLAYFLLLVLFQGKAYGRGLLLIWPSS